MRLKVRVAMGVLSLGCAGIGVTAGAHPADAAAVHGHAAQMGPNVVTAYAGEMFSYSPGVATPYGVGSWHLVSPAGSLPPGLKASTVGATVVISGVPRVVGRSVLELGYDTSSGGGVARVVIDARAALAWGHAYFALDPAPASVASLAAPGSVDWSAPTDAATLGNSSYNDCVVAAGHHLLAGQAHSVGVAVGPLTTAMAMTTYHQLLDGPVTTSAGGANEEAMLSLEATSGLDNVRAIAASSLETGSRAELEAAVDELGGVLAGVKQTPAKSFAPGAADLRSSPESITEIPHP